jgi:hypothetical protein
MPDFKSTWLLLMALGITCVFDQLKFAWIVGLWQTMPGYTLITWRMLGG